MKLKFVRIKKGGHDVDAGEVWIEHGVLHASRHGLEQNLRKHPVHDARGRELHPSDGDRYLTALYHQYGRGSYLRAQIVEEEQPSRR
jgi:hypothetical protein